MDLVLSIFKNFIVIDLYSKNTHSPYIFRLPVTFWSSSTIQVKILQQLYQYIRKQSGLALAKDGLILPSNLLPDINKIILFKPASRPLNQQIVSVADVSYNQNCSGMTSVVSNKNCLFIDYDIDRIGVFLSSAKNELSEYHKLKLKDYFNAGLEKFFLEPAVCNDKKDFIQLGNFILSQSLQVLNQSGVKDAKIQKIVFSGILPILVMQQKLSNLKIGTLTIPTEKIELKNYCELIYR